VLFEWDEIKRQINIRKHALDFIDVISIFEGVTLTIEDTRLDYGEIRYITLGLLKEYVIVVAHTDEGDVIRIISARKATKNEERRYFEQITD
jgi:uncharacterized DUF497 family protein